MRLDADVIVVGGGLAGLVATAELADAGRRVILVDQEPEASLGGQAFWSFGGLFLVDSPEQRRLGIHDSRRAGLAGLAGQRRLRPARGRLAAALGRGVRGLRRGREALLAARAGRALLPDRRLGRTRRLPRRRPRQLGAALPHHLGHRPRPWSNPSSARSRGRAPSRPRATAVPASGRRADRDGGAVTGVRGSVLEPAGAARGQASSREVAGEFALTAQAVLVTSGGIGGNHELVRQNWPARLGPPPATCSSGVPAHVDGRMLEISEAAGRRLINRDRMWHYTEGIANWNPIWPRHGIRILPGPVLALAGRARPPAAGAAVPRLRHARHARAHHGHRLRVHLVRAHPEDHREGVRALRLRAEPRPDRQEHPRQLLGRARPGRPGPVEAFKRHGADFVVARTCPRWSRA